MNKPLVKLIQDPSVQNILIKVLMIQRDAYKKISKKSYEILLEGEILLLQAFGSSKDEIESRAEELTEKYNELINRPEMVLLLPYQEIVTLRHILWRMEDEWLADINAINGLWDIFFTLEEMHKPEIGMSLKILKGGKN